MVAVAVAMGGVPAAAAPWRVGGNAALHPRRAALEAAPPAPYTNYTQTQYWFNGQRLDHFNLTDGTTWAQRYWLVTDFWASPTSPVILYLCGEYTCPGVMASRLFPLELAYEHGALVVVVEHRFYGASQPFPALNTSVLPYLNSRQALADLAWFTGFLQGQINANASRPADATNQWLVVGGSYPGAMSAWYRIKYPHLTVGSLASSGVVNAFVEYPQFDQQVAASAGPDCANALRNVTARIGLAMPGIKAAFGAANLSDGDFWFFVADAGAEGIQYAAKAELCGAVTPVWLAGGDPLPAYVNYTVAYWEAVMGNSAADYDSNVLADPVAGGDGRAWWWQVCTEFGWWQVAPAVGSIRSAAVNNTWYAGFCAKLFGVTTLPDVAGTNNNYGGGHPAGYNIFFSQGVQDPWRWAGVQETLNPVEQAQVVDCDTCAHCVDLYTPTPDDAPTLVSERALVKDLVASWFAGH